MPAEHTRFALTLSPVEASRERSVSGFAGASGRPTDGVTSAREQTSLAGEQTALGREQAALACEQSPLGRQDVTLAREQAVSVLLDLGLGGWQEDGSRLVFWLPAERLGEPAVNHGLERLARLGRIEATTERDDWLRRWRSLHVPVEVDRVCVRPPWAQPAAGMLDVVIDIGLAFGTGSHVTTMQCLELLQRVEPGSLLDVGTGSGVLAIAAERLGYRPVTGIDNDEVAVAAAWDNGLRNGAEAEFGEADALDPAFRWPEVDVAVANLTLSPLIRLGERLAEASAGEAAPADDARARPRPPRDVIIAGLLDDQAGAAVAAFGGYREHCRLSCDGWTAVHLRCGGLR